MTHPVDVLSDPRAVCPTPPGGVGQYAFVRQAGGLLFLAGIGPRRADTRAIPGVRVDGAGNVLDYDIEFQVRQCFANVNGVLRNHGSEWGRIIDVTVFMTDLPRDFEAFNALWQEYFPHLTERPCRTTVEVSRLPQAGDSPINFEVKVVATLRHDSPAS